jgi:hypothetical protein
MVIGIVRSKENFATARCDVKEVKEVEEVKEKRP